MKSCHEEMFPASCKFVCFGKLTWPWFLPRDTGPGGAGGHSPPDFFRSINPISTKGCRLIPPHYYLSPTDFLLSHIPVAVDDIKASSENLNFVSRFKLELAVVDLIQENEMKPLIIKVKKCLITQYCFVE